ncbi:pyruvate ferredoxin oxidoreductasse [POR] alpha subunit [Thermoplasma volcanium GSS1]|uniref:Pyruvate ferredoxin oxidoreductasse [POR] alpha subunit n=1 Tax=Thermoplasma volcanium (strain ATCC 51530 / DSM 4299 / JCM 9571 / NBRC 15438 / GSS1) TaxID=273116 RepID=Q97AG1_THEVO|nr:2-ketoisovalerate ferredoxin oxidoreductase subunit alpha [Thermoplasma volcanium]BAB59991.1 pyruvate ferredoxin oxidoreductasse [POR] alpha subunit [Thermoplasma volcanium GSS1]
MKSMQDYRTIMTGNDAVAYGAKLARVKLISAYPITPQTTIVEKLASMIANDELDAKYVKVESEHSALATVVSSELAGVRSYTATSSHGLLYMHEMLHWASGQRLPIVMSVVNRAIGPPWNIWADQSDTMNQKDTGWMQVYCESNQEALDTIIMGYKIAENKDVLLPLMSMEDAFILSHTSEPVTIRDQESVNEYLPDLDLPFKINEEHPMGYGSYDTPDGSFMELKKDMVDSMQKAKRIIEDETRKFNEMFGTEYGGLIEKYRMEDADYAIIATGTIASTARYVVDILRKKGEKVGLIRIRYFRPFPYEEILSSLKYVKAAGVIDRSVSFSSGGPTYVEIVQGLYGKLNVPLSSFIAGIGGRDVRIQDIENIYEMLKSGNSGTYWINVKEVR